MYLNKVNRTGYHVRSDNLQTHFNDLMNTEFIEEKKPETSRIKKRQTIVRKSVREHHDNDHEKQIRHSRTTDHNLIGEAL